jgi:hypothetical protein
MINANKNFTLKITANTTSNSSVEIAGASVTQKARTPVYKTIKVGGVTFPSTTPGSITKSKTTQVSSGTRSDVGTSDEAITYTVDSTIPYNKNVKIASIRISPSAGYQRIGSPGIKLNKSIDGLSIYIKNTNIRDEYDLMCNASRSIGTLDGATATFEYTITKVYSPSKNLISKIFTDSLSIPISGGNKITKIYGAPNTPFELSVIEEDAAYRFNSITSAANIIGSTPYGNKRVLSDKIGDTGVYTHVQNYPPIPTVLKTTVDGNFAAGASTMIFAKTAGVVVGDEIVVNDSSGRRIQNNETIKVTAINVDGNDKKLTFTHSMKLADKKVVVFRRTADYHLNITSAGDTTWGSSINRQYPMFDLKQSIGTVITFKATDSNVNTVINGGSAGEADFALYGSGNKYNNNIRLVYTLTGRTFTTNQHFPSKGDIVSTAGDAKIKDIKIKAEGSGTSTCVITADLSIEFGDKDSSFAVALANTVS